MSRHSTETKHTTHYIMAQCSFCPLQLVTRLLETHDILYFIHFHPQPSTYLVEADDVRMAKDLHNLHLTHDLLEVVGVQLRLVDDLDGHLKSAEAGDGRVMVAEDARFSCGGNRGCNMWTMKK